MKKFLALMIMALAITYSTSASATWYNPMTWVDSDVVSVYEPEPVVEEVVIVSQNGIEFIAEEGANQFPVSLQCKRYIAEKDYVCNKTVYVYVNGYKVTVQVSDNIKRKAIPPDIYADFLSNK